MMGAALQTLPRKAMTSANAAGAPGLRTYLTHDESRHHRVSGPIAPIHERADSPASARTGRQKVPVATGLATLSAWESVPSGLPRSLTCDTVCPRVTVRDRSSPGLMAR